MKKFLTILMAACLLMPAAGAQNTAVSKALNKALKKEYKTKLKDFKKGGWELFGTTKTMEVALLSHYDRLAELGEDGHEVVGVAPKFQSKNVGHQMAINNASVTYAQEAGSHVKGRVVADLSGDGVDASSEFDHFYAAYERLVEKEIKGEMQESFSIIRPNNDGTYEMQTYFIVSESAASKARIRALEDAAKESAAAQQYAKKVADFVREGFE